jgi:glycosyltransferase involved in cell wall biosynthesis
MKICLLSNLYYPYIIGGAELYVGRIAGHLAKNNQVFVITTKPYDGLRSLSSSLEIQKGIKVYKFFPLNVYHTYHAQKTITLIKPIWHTLDLWNLHSYHLIRKILNQEKPDVVHIHNLGGFSLSTFDAIKYLNLPSVYTLHDYYFLSPLATLFFSGKVSEKELFPGRVLTSVKRRIIDSKPDLVISPTKFVMDLARRNEFFAGSRKSVLPHGIEIPCYTDIDKDYETIDILYAGSVSLHKGVHILIQAFKQINSNRVRLHIAGEGPNLKESKRMAAADRRIRFYGFQSGEGFRELYKQANVTVVPSLWYEVFSLVILESFCYGTPVVASNIGGIPEVIEDGYNGFLFEAGNVAELRKALEDLIENRELLEDLNKNALASVKKYEISKHIEKLKLLYKSVAKNEQN